MARSILGISAFYHDSAAALVVDGEIVAAAQEERFTRVKHDAGFPARAAAYCLREAGLAPDALEHVVFYEKPLRKFHRLIETQLAFAPGGFAAFAAAMPLWAGTKLRLGREIRRGLGGGYRGRIAFTGHHEAHAASTFFPSPFEEAAILTVDGVGEWDTATIGRGRGNRLEILRTLRFPHSLGLLYSAFTAFCGFRVNSGEYKLMGLAPYGQPRYADRILRDLVDVKEDGSLALDQSYFNYCQGMTMTNRKFADAFGGPPRLAGGAITEREADLAASVQKVVEESLLRMAATARRLTGSRNLCLAGGVALNCVANGRLLRSGIFDRIFVTPAAGDAGGAPGAALFLEHQVLGRPRLVRATDSLKGSLLGPRFGNAQIRSMLDGKRARYTCHGNESGLLEAVAREIAQGKVVGWFQGRMEFGPRALGSRSILGDPRSERMQSQMNLRIKFRESFRPFAPSVLAEDAGAYFDCDVPSPYMAIVCGVRRDLWRIPAATPPSWDQEPDLCRRAAMARSTLPAITHVDMSARIQTVDEERHGRYCRLIREFKRQTGCPVIINTSFNIRGEPMVCTPEDAHRCFMATEMDLLVLEDCVLRRSEQPALGEEERRRHIASFQPD